MIEGLPRRETGSWNVIYQPEISRGVLGAYTYALRDLAAIYTPSLYRRFADIRLKGHEAVALIGESMSQTFEDFGLHARDGRIAFTVPLETETGERLANQAVLTLSGADPQVYAVVDVASYIYGFPYKDMPAAIGMAPIIEQAFSELYTARTGNQVDTQYFPPGTRLR